MDLIEMAVDSIRIHMPSGQHVVVLKEKDAERFLPIWVGSAEANSIALALRVNSPIYVSSEVMDQAAVVPRGEDEEAKLEVFQQMVNEMNLPDLDDQEG